MNQGTEPLSFEVNCDSRGVARMTLNQPDKMNALDRDFWTAFPKAVEQLSDKGEARAIIFDARGKHFTAGMDLAVFHQLIAEFENEPARQGEYMRRWILSLQNAPSALENCRPPVIAAVQGACIGGGVDLICAADMRFCTRDAFFSIKEIDLAITADVGTLQRIEKVMPAGLARELAYTGRKMGAEEALGCGFVNRVFDSQEEMLEACDQLAAEIAAKSPVAVTGIKEMLNFSRDHSVADSLNHMATWQAGMFKMQDVKECLKSIQEKRNAEFEDLRPLEFQQNQ